jgi:acyl-CoA thioester hydrolase
MPVVEMHCRFLRAAQYDDLLTVKTTLKELPTGHKIEFYQEVFNEAGKLLTSGRIVLFFMQANGMDKTTMPEELFRKLAPFFQS